MKKSLLVIVLSSSCFMLAVACGGSDPSAANDSMVESRYIQAEEAAFDGVSPLRVSADGLGLSLGPVAQAPSLGEGAWRLALESNRPLADLLAYELDGERLDLFMTDEYHAELRLSAEQLERILARQALYLELEARGGDRRSYSAVVHLEPRVTEAEGSLLIWLESAMVSSLVNRQVRFEGFATTASRIAKLNVVTDNAAATETRPLGRSRWSFAWSTADMLRAMQAEGSNFSVLGRDEAQNQHLVEARLQVVVSGLGLTTGQAMQEWPADACRTEVQRCLNVLPRRDTQDTSACGSAAEVLACGALPF